LDKVVPIAGREVATTLSGKQITAMSRGESPDASSSNARTPRSSVAIREKPQSEGAKEIETARKLAFGYFTVSRRMDPDDAMRYSQQLQSYLADAGNCVLLDPDEMGLLMKKRGGNLHCGNEKSALKVGRLLGVDYMGFGSIHRGFNSFSIKVGIIDVKHGTPLVMEKRRFRGREFVFFNEIIPQLAYKLGEVLERERLSERRSSLTGNSPSGKAVREQSVFE